jgi:hypothetical protein
MKPLHSKNFGSGERRKVLEKMKEIGPFGGNAFGPDINMLLKEINHE